MNKKTPIFLLLSLSISLNLYAKDCTECTPKITKEVQPDKKVLIDLRKNVQGPLEMASKGELIINSRVSRGPAVVKTEVSSKRSYQGAYCLKFGMCQDWVDVEALIEDMEKSPYPESLKEFWTTPACDSLLMDKMKVPLIFNLADDPVRGEKWPQTIYEYFVEEKNDMETWIKIINTKSNDGMTFLDYMQFNINKGQYNLSMPAAKRVVDYICKHGGVYSKYKDSAKCP